MAAFSVSAFFICLTFLFFRLKFVFADQSSSFSFQSFDKDPNFESNFVLYGDANAVDNGSVLQLIRPMSSSAGLVMYKKPIKLVEGNPIHLVSFSSHFSFSMSPDNGDGLAFVMVSDGFRVSALDSSSPFGVFLRSKKNSSEFLAVEFDTKLDANYGDLNDNHVGINVGGFVSVKKKNASSVNLVLNSGKKLSSWIDYQAGSKRLEVRLSEYGNSKPMDPLLSYPIDLSKSWKDGKFYIGLSSSNGNSSQSCFIYSWSFIQRHIPQWMHSQPLNPQAFAKNVKPVVSNEGNNCLSRVVVAMILGTACGALGASAVLYLWTILGNRSPVAPEECSVHPVEFEYKKVKVVVEKAHDDNGKV